MVDGTPQRLRFNAELNWGHILIFVAVIGSGLSVYVANEVRASRLEFRIQAIEVFMIDARHRSTKIDDQLTTILVDVATIKARLPRSSSRLIRPTEGAGQ